MTEHTPETEPEISSPDVDPAETAQEFAEPQRTGVEVVDDVLASMRGLDESPVDEHPAVFESAHDRLRQALDGPAGD